MYFADAIPPTAALRAFWAAAAPALPMDVHVLVGSTGDIISDTDGSLQGTWSAPVTAVVDGSSNGVYAAPVGALVRWKTNSVLDAHRVSGSTFVVPISSPNFDGAGQIAASFQGVLANAAAALVVAAAPGFAIWHRPLTAAQGARMIPPRPAHLGATAVITGSGVPTKAVVLRSRRD